MHSANRCTGLLRGEACGDHERSSEYLAVLTRVSVASESSPPPIFKVAPSEDRSLEIWGQSDSE